MLTEEYKGYQINLEQDNDAFSPREDFDNLGTMACFHSRYILGDKDTDIDPKDFGGWYEMQEYIEKDLNAICLPVYAYIHSGVRLSTVPFSCQWDSAQVGFVFVPRAKAREEFNCKRISKKKENQILEYLKGEVETMDKFVSGEVYYYTVSKDDDIIDSCGCIYGREYALEMAKEHIDFHNDMSSK